MKNPKVTITITDTDGFKATITMKNGSGKQAAEAIYQFIFGKKLPRSRHAD